MWLKSKSGESEARIGNLGELESALMERMWNRGEANVPDVHAEFSPLAYTTIMTTMARLWKKGLLNRRKVSKAYVYIPAMTKHEYESKLTQYLLKLAFDHAENSGAVLTHFVDAVGVDEKALAKMEKLIKAKQRSTLKSRPHEP